MLSALLLAITLLDAPQVQITVIDLDGGEPRHLVVVIDGEPYKVTSIPAGSGPLPGPTPPPAPPEPAPSPVAGVLWVTYIQPAVPTVDDAAPLSHAPLRARLDGVSVRFRSQAANDAEIERRKFTDIAKSAPVTVFQSETGKILKVLPGNNPQAILDTIVAFKGAK